MKLTLKVCLLLVASLFLITLASGMPQEAKDQTAGAGPKKASKKKLGSGTINPIEQGGTAAHPGTAVSESVGQGASAGPASSTMSSEQPAEPAQAAEAARPAKAARPANAARPVGKAAKKKTIKTPPAPPPPQ